MFFKHSVWVCFNFAHTRAIHNSCANTRITLARDQEKPGNWPKIKCLNSVCPLYYILLLLGSPESFFTTRGKAGKTLGVIILDVVRGWVNRKVIVNKRI